MTYELVIVGGGNMGAALLEGLIESGTVATDRVAVVDLDDDRCAELRERFGVIATSEMQGGESALLAVKPQHIPAAASAAVAAGATRLLSIAAGVTTDTVAAAAGEQVRVVRAMPNTPALVGAGVSGLAAGPGATDADLDWAATLLGSVGVVVRVPEDDLDAVTGLTGSGPAYIFLIAESLIDAGRDVGLPEDGLEPMVTQLLVGAAELLKTRGDPAALRLAVTSPGGTTERGVATLRSRGLPEAITAAVRAATERGRELGASSS